jgi:hypothetical protein
MGQKHLAGRREMGTIESENRSSPFGQARVGVDVRL